MNRMQDKTPMAAEKICLLTGASTGLGRALALELAERGYRVLAVARSQDLLMQLAQQHQNIRVFALDVTNEGAMQQLTQAISLDYGRLDLVLLNAGTCEYVQATDLDLAAFDRTFALNFRAVVAATKMLLPLVPRGGQLAFVSSLAHLFPFGRAEAYGASKAALSYFADSLRADLAATGIEVCLIEPGFVDTPLTRKNDFPMPFLLPAGEAAQRIASKLASKAKRIRFPQRLVWSLQVLRCLPYGIRQRVAAGFARQGGSDAT
jgi:NAD(P)-dependent dehydrogenase (short-subunit alcohol dehydrogenase family)